jgi:hypothetical protein
MVPNRKKNHLELIPYLIFIKIFFRGEVGTRRITVAFVDQV